MNRLLLAIVLNCSSLCAFAQTPCDTPQSHFIRSNRIGAYIYNDGTLFNDINSSGGFKFPYVVGGQNINAIANASLWMGGFDLGGNLKVAASSPIGSGFPTDFQPGPLDPLTGFPYTNIPCEFLNKIWVVTGEEIIDFLKDWQDNKKIDEQHLSIFSWPGNGNPHFYPIPLPFSEQGWAPFYDMNDDEIYDPLYGDFPMHENFEVYFPSFYIPGEITWTVFHDNTQHNLSNSPYPIIIEVQQTAWTRECDSQPEVENTVFVDYKLINRGLEDIDRFYAAIVVDFAIGCPDNDYTGSIPSLNAFIGYNRSSNDSTGFCDGYGKYPPVVSVKFIEGIGGARLDKFMYCAGYGIEDPDPRITHPISPDEYYHFLSGKWKDGTPLTYGGFGYNPVSTNYTDFAFSGNPNNNGEWSMLEDNLPNFNYQAIGSTGFSDHWNPNSSGSKIQPGKSLRFSVAFTCHSNPFYNHIELIDKMINDDLKNLDLAYFGEYGINGPYCQSYSIQEPEDEEEVPFISGIYPNPTTGELTIAIPETTIEEIAVYNTAWQLLYIDKTPKEEVQIIDLQGFAQGIYFLRMKLDGQTLVRKIVVK